MILLLPLIVGLCKKCPIHNVTLIFESPNKPRKLCLVSFGQSFKALLMVVVTSFKISLTTAIIYIVFPLGVHTDAL